MAFTPEQIQIGNLGSPTIINTNTYFTSGTLFAALPTHNTNEAYHYSFLNLGLRVDLHGIYRQNGRLSVATQQML
jgi:hypothetical protein